MSPTGSNGQARAPIEPLIAELGGRAEDMWTSLAPALGTRGSVRVLFTATEAGAGTSTLAAVTAYEMAHNLRRSTVLVEANLRRPAVAGYLASPRTPGLADLLDGRARLESCRHRFRPGSPLEIVPGGSPRAPVPGELVSQAAQDAFIELSRDVQVLILDAPPIGDGPEARLLFDHVDGVVLVLRARHTFKEDAQRAVGLVRAAGLPLLGAIMNRYRPEYGAASR